jgi:prevent-host-death family protein
MPTVSATHAKQNFAAILDAAQREPVRIRRHEREVAVVMSLEEFNRLSAIAAKQAKANGLSEEILAEILTD